MDILIYDIPQYLLLATKGTPGSMPPKTPSFKRFGQTSERNHVPAHLGSAHLGNPTETLPKKDLGMIYPHHKNNPPALLPIC
jgi:hypothetical protein